QIILMSSPALNLSWLHPILLTLPQAGFPLRYILLFILYSLFFVLSSKSHTFHPQRMLFLW
ncbi:MAG: hypothetical protein PHO94_12225, partial [Petrimonas sp.]|nr:hypothetical protein [Petrimonas sp.]